MSINRAYSHITLKTFDDDLREIVGIATSPSTDRLGDIVEPGGGEYTLPIPLLWQHDRAQPIGEVFMAKVTGAGIEIRARLVKPIIGMPSQLAARLDEAWASIKTKLVRGLSIGFSPIEYSLIEGGGVRFTKWNWTELSAVTIACNAEASISAIKSIDLAMLAPVGESLSKVGANAPAEGKTIVTLKSKVEKMKFAEQIKGFQAELVAKKADRVGIMTKAEGRTLEQAEQESFDTLGSEIQAIEKHLANLKSLQTEDVKTATAVDDVTKATPAQHISVKANYAEKGLAMAQYVRVLSQANGSPFVAAQIAESQKGAIDPRVNELFKAAVPAANTGVPAWGGNLITQGGVIGDFVEFLRPQTVLGKFGAGGIPGLRSVPFNVPLIGQTAGGSGYWVGEGKAKPLTQFAYGTNILQPLKVANIAVITNELLKRASVSADSMIRDQLVAALVERLDIDFLAVAKAAVAGISPASITNGVAGVASSGNDAAAVRTDVQALFAAFLAANNVPSTAVWIMRSTTALALSLMQNPLGQTEFPGLGMTGGMFMGMPTIVSDYAPAGTVVLVNAQDIYFADEGGFEVKMSTEASLEMDSAPAHDSTTPTPAQLVSMFQTNSTAFLAERHLNWSKRRPGAVQLLTGVAWGQPAVGGGG